MRALFLIAATALALPAAAQWTIQTSGTTADLRGIANAGNGIAWASGTEGTVLRTTDTGKTWQRCPTPPNAEHLDFRGIQAFDANTAIVMSSGKGDLSRLYKTTDACQTWTLLFTNPDKEGFLDAIQVQPGTDKSFVTTTILGDQVEQHFTLFNLHVSLRSNDAVYLVKFPNVPCRADLTKLHLQLPDQLEWCFDKFPRYQVPLPRPDEGSFAASNTALLSNPDVWFDPTSFVTGGPNGARFIQYRNDPCAGLGCESWVSVDLPMTKGSASGAFSLAARIEKKSPKDWHGVIVGGNYQNPANVAGTAVFSEDEGTHWLPATTPPHGYRSAVAYDAPTKTWITVGPNGTDISTDDGRNWRPLKPSPTDTPDADRNWNALSLPFVVGPHGRIGILNPTALQSPKTP
jgi:photosystem II stability/assembly factor-like uncharacterized protein